jgi:hypothetical protein
MADPLSAFVSELDPAAEPAAGGSEPIAPVVSTGTDRASWGFRCTWLHATIWLLMAVALAEAALIVTWGVSGVVPPQSDPPATAVPIAAAPEPAQAVRPTTVAGWLTVTSPAPAHIYEGGALVGTTESPRILLTAGSHELEFNNAGLGFNVVRSVTIEPGEATALALEPATGTLTLTSHPATDAWVDGRPAGLTPIDRLSLPIGRRLLVLRHPQYGERQQLVVIPVAPPVSLTIDLRP